MQPRGIIAYIQTEKAINTPKDKIVEHLQLSGYPQADIDQAFKELERDPEMAQAGVFANLVTDRRPKNHFFGWLVAFVIFNIVIFAAFSFLYNSTIFISNPVLSSSTNSSISPDSSTPTPTSAPVTPIVPSTTNTPPPSSAPSPVATPTVGISSDDKDQIISAIITQNAVLGSGNAADIRNYLEITASPQYKQQLEAMSDSAIISLASTITAGESYVTADSLNSAQVVWLRTSDTSVQVTISTPNGSVVRTSNQSNGVWY